MGAGRGRPPNCSTPGPRPTPIWLSPRMERSCVFMSVAGNRPTSRLPWPVLRMRNRAQLGTSQSLSTFSPAQDAYDGGMSVVDIQTILKQVEELLARAGELPTEAEQAVGKLLNVVEALSADNRELANEVERLRQQLEQKKKSKTTGGASQDDNQTTKSDSDYSSEKRRQRDKKANNTRDRRSFKDLTIHQEIECPIDPATLPSDAVRVEDESVVVQDIEIKPRNIRFQRHVYYSAAAGKFFRGPLPNGYDMGDFGVDLRSLALSLKYCGNMSEPNIRAFRKTLTSRFRRAAYPIS